MSPHNLHSNSSPLMLARGAAAGIVATLPMTGFMLLGRRIFFRRKDYLLPPQQITEELAERLNLDDKMTTPERDLTALSLHFGYGALTGSGYALLEPAIPLPAPVKGSLAGLAVWVGSYLAWLPATGILQLATRHPRRLNILMILAHLVWGITLGVVFRKLNSSQ